MKINDESAAEENSRDTRRVESSDYNPYEHRNVKYPTTFFDTWVHLLKANLGTGILAMPNAFKNAGYAVAMVGTFVIGFLCTYCIHLLIATSYKLCVQRQMPSLSYAKTVEVAFEDGPEMYKKYAPCAKLFTNIFLVLYQIGTSSIYLVFIAKNLKTIGDVYLDNNAGERMYIVYLILPLIAITCVRNLKRLSPFSSAATILTFSSLLMITYYVFVNCPISFVDRPAVGTVYSIPKFFGTVLFAMEAIGMILPLQNEMKNPSEFGTVLGVLNISMFIITVLYAAVGLMGYLKYGNQVRGSITLNLPEEELLSQIIKVCLSLSIYINYALSNYVAFNIIWHEERSLENSKYKIYAEYALRVALVLLTFVIAVTVPTLEHLISLIGAFCLSTVGIALPAVINHITFSDDRRDDGFWKHNLFCLRNFAIVVIAAFAFVVGVSTVLSNIFNQVLR